MIDREGIELIHEGLQNLQGVIKNIEVSDNDSVFLKAIATMYVTEMISLIEITESEEDDV